MYSSSYFARYLRNDNFADTSMAIASNKIKLDYPESQIKSFLDICYGVPTKARYHFYTKIIFYKIYENIIPVNFGKLLEFFKLLKKIY